MSKRPIHPALSPASRPMQRPGSDDARTNERPRRRLGRWLAAPLLALWLAAPVQAQTQAQTQAPSPPLPPALEQRAEHLAHGLRCLVCQNQSLAESNAPLAHDMRNLIRGQLAEGRSDAQIMRFFEDRYGDFVRYEPHFKPITWLLWLGPFALLVLGFVVLWRTVARRPRSRPPLTADERARAARYLDTGS